MATALATEQLDWFCPAEQMPDSDTTVMVRLALPDGEPVWLGYYDSQEWQDVEGNPIDVLAWAHLPDGPNLPAPARCAAIYQGLQLQDQRGTACCRPAGHEGDHRGSNHAYTLEWA